MENLFCRKLASYLRMKPSQSPSLEPPLFRRKSRINATVDHCSNGPVYYTDETEPTRNESTKELLKEIWNSTKEISELLKTRVHTELEEQFEDARKDGIKQNWMLAAAVFDRIFSIFFAIVFVIGTLVFIIAFSIHTKTGKDL